MNFLAVLLRLILSLPVVLAVSSSARSEQFLSRALTRHVLRQTYQALAPPKLLSELMMDTAKQAQPHDTPREERFLFLHAMDNNGLPPTTPRPDVITPFCDNPREMCGLILDDDTFQLWFPTPYYQAVCHTTAASAELWLSPDPTLFEEARLPNVNMRHVMGEDGDVFDAELEAKFRDPHSRFILHLVIGKVENRTPGSAPGKEGHSIALIKRGPFVEVVESRAARAGGDDSPAPGVHPCTQADCLFEQRNPQGTRYGDRLDAVGVLEALRTAATGDLEWATYDQGRQDAVDEDAPRNNSLQVQLSISNIRNMHCVRWRFSSVIRAGPRLSVSTTVLLWCEGIL